MLHIVSTSQSFSYSLPGFSHVTDHLSGSSNSAKTNGVSVHTVILDELDPSRVRSEIPTYLTGAFGSKIQGHHVPELGNVILKVLEDAASLSVDDAVNFVKTKDFVHFFSTHNDLVLDRDGASNQSSVPSLGANCDFFVLAVFQHLRDLLCGCGVQNKRSLALVLLGKVKIM